MQPSRLLVILAIILSLGIILWFYCELSVDPLLMGEAMEQTGEDQKVPRQVGPKFDQGKQQWYAMPLVHLHPLADAFTAGEVKYSLFSNLYPFEEADRRFWNATMRHLEECQVNPLAIDPETGCYHAAEACFSILMRLSNARRVHDPKVEEAFRKATGFLEAARKTASEGES